MKDYKVGDIMVKREWPFDRIAITRVDSDGDFCGVCDDGDVYFYCDPEEWRKTGNNYGAELKELLDKIGGESE